LLYVLRMKLVEKRMLIKVKKFQTVITKRKAIPIRDGFS